MAPKDPYKYFRLEARELLTGLERGVGALRGTPDDAAAVKELLRLAHTMKGAARVVRLPAVADVAHKLEDILIAAREQGLILGPPQREELTRLIAQIASALAVLDAPVAAPAPAPAGATAAPLASETPALAGTAPTSAPAAALSLVAMDTVQLQAAEVDATLAGLGETSAELAALRADLRIVEHAGQQARRVYSLLLRHGEGVAASAISLAAEAADLVAEIDRARRRLHSRTERIDRDWQRLREDTARLRLVPTHALWSYLQQAVAEAARTLGKTARFEADGRTPRLDIPTFSALQQALLHLVRNAVAHGLEPAAQRVAAGKPAEGCVRVSLTSTCDRLHVVCEDDGRGIDAEAVRRAAVAQGRLPAGAATLDVAGAVEQLLRGGLSTAVRVDEVSGRGVGLDAVRAAVARVQGKLILTSVPGRGTNVRIEIPIALSAMEALAITSAHSEWLLPLFAVKRVVQATAAELCASAMGQDLPVDGRMIPFAALNGLGQAHSANDVRPSKLTAVIVQDGEHEVALGVERLLGVVEAVVRPVPSGADVAEFVGGASLEAAGAPRLVADVPALVRAVRSSGAPAAKSTKPALPILVVDDSLTTRMLERSILESAGYAVDLATSGEEALERLQARRYGLMLVDVEMPGMDGFAVIGELRRNPDWRDLPAILVTSLDSPEHRRRGLAAGAQDYVIKGEFDQRRLLQRIRELLQ